ncbi:HET-domain-containing [Fusarium albosuccineum]|uniref:HET-domain-containing n=1 Tax=Fusarium albosuccineum TaxID=1237068 RepID=A0A8H4KZX9_9HYPO|nr:HET-domain-containing [Fusarium albosuccineum]
MTICSLCLPALAVPTPLPTLQKPWLNRISALGSRSGSSSTPYFLAPKDDNTPLDQVGVPHHSSLDALSRSAENCPLCQIIQQRVDKFIADFKQIEQDALSRYFTVDSQGHGLPDEWNFRLVRRLDGADGFSVLTSGKREWMIYLLDAFGFCVEPEESRYSISNLSEQDTENRKGSSTERIRGARVDPDAGSKSALDLATGWIDYCVANHDNCRPPQGCLPSRLLDLAAFDDPRRIRLWETNGTTTSDPYVTLSHCWGTDTSHHVRTTHATLSGHLDGMSIQTLPQTFQDAIKVTRHFGIRYLWIDSLCICQDDLDDWARESAAMQQVYAGAYLTIAADRAPGSTNGFLTRSERKHVPITLKFTPGDAESNTTNKSEAVDTPAFAFEVPPFNTINGRSWLELANEPLTSRAWAMQERLLPQRVLHFATGQLFFECNRNFLSEDGVEVLGRWNSLNPGGDKTFQEIARKSRISTIHQLWYFILEDFTRRNLTVNTDWLPAISGLAALIKAKLSIDKESDKPQDVEYVAGLWSNAVVEGLGWSSFRRRRKNIIFPDESPLSGEEGYIAPTWSPASYEGTSAHGMTMNGWVDVAVVTGWNVTPKNTKNPFGEVVDGWISLRAPMVKMELSELPDIDEAKLPKDWRRNMRLCTPQGDRYGSFSSFDGIQGQTAETRAWVERNEIFALFLSKRDYLGNSPDIPWSYHALLVIPVNPERQVRAGRKEFRRVGTTHLDSDSIGSDEEVVRNSDRFLEAILV